MCKGIEIVSVAAEETADTRRNTMIGSTLRMVEGNGQEGLAKLFDADAKMFGNRIFIFSYPTLRTEEDLCYLRIREANQDEYTNTDLPLRETFLLQFLNYAGQSCVADSGELRVVIPMQFVAQRG